MLLTNIKSNFYENLMKASENGNKFGSIGITDLDPCDFGNIGVCITPLKKLGKPGIIVEVLYERKYKNDFPDQHLSDTYHSCYAYKGITIGNFIPEDFDPDQPMPFLKPSMSLHIQIKEFKKVEDAKEWLDTLCNDIVSNLDKLIDFLVKITNYSKREYLWKHIMLLDSIDRRYIT